MRKWELNVNKRVTNKEINTYKDQQREKNKRYAISISR